MGIRGLTTYISRNSELFHDPLRLHDCLLIIDGNSLASNLYVEVSKCNSFYGGDYDKYSTAVLNFFSLLSKCNINPLVVMDGGYETRKLKTVESRMKAKLLALRLYRYSSPNVPVFPLLMKEAFKQTLRDIGVNLVQADFEADSEVAAIARQLNCPVLSQDSDFYVLDVLYIPFSTLNLRVSKVRNPDGSMKKYLKCQIFRTEKFLQHFGGLDKSLLPLMGTLLGNDYVPISSFEKFFSHIKLPKTKKMSAQQRKIHALFDWLRRESDMESALAKIAAFFKKDARKKLLEEIHKSLAAYRHCVSDLISGLNLNCDDTPWMNVETSTDVEEPGSHLPMSGEWDSLVTDESAEDCTDDSSCEDIPPQSNSEYSSPPKEASRNLASLPSWPEWMLDMFRKGSLPSFVSDMYYLQIFYCHPQVEDLTLEDSHAISFPILRISYSLLMNSILQASEKSQKVPKKNSLMCITRGSGTKVHKLELEPVLGLPCLLPFPALRTLPSVPIHLRREVLISTMGFQNEKDVKILVNFPDEWMLFAMVISYWGRSSVNPKVNIYLLHAVILTWIILGVVDFTLANDKVDNNHRFMQHIRHEHLAEEVSPEDSFNKDHPEDPSTKINMVEATSLKQIFAQISTSDCQLLKESLLQFRTVQPNYLRGNKNFPITVLHSLAQLQTCLQQAMVLNALLCGPFPEIKLCNTYSGALAFSSFMTLNKVSNLETFMKSLFKDSHSVRKAYESLILTFKLLLPDLSVPIRKARRRTKKSIHIENSSCSEDLQAELESEEESIILLDKNNKFSVLSVL